MSRLRHTVVAAGTPDDARTSQGCEIIALHVTNCENVCYEESNHWLYMEEPERFAKDVGSFVRRTTAACRVGWFSL